MNADDHVLSPIFGYRRSSAEVIINDEDKLPIINNPIK